MQSSEALLIGMPKEEIDTPALVIDLDVMEANIAKMASYFAGRKSNVRPHFKTHKCPNIAQMQLQAGADGITCAKVEEAEALVNGGVLKNILIANQIVSKPKIAKLMGLNRHAEVMVCVDDPQNISDLSDAAQLSGVELGVLVEVNVGMNRCGVDTPEEALELAKQVEKAKGLRFMGLQGYEGHVVMVPDFEERKAAVLRDMQRLLEARQMVEKAGLPVTIVDGAGTGTYSITGDIPGVDEIQAG
ncbi:MAG: alanine racemase [Chloroflexi bacterium]|nr:alanine racemase [Chloroflexota bacterium]